MKLQGFSVIFVLIIVPLVLILSFYIQMQVDTIALQTSYNTMLLDATYDAMSAFELNTSNEDLSSISDSLRSIIQASNNVFVNVLATSMGMSNASKSYIEPYVPAILYTLYDGYYIYSPTNTPEVLSDESGVVVTVEESTKDSRYFSTPGLKYEGGSYTYNEAETDTEHLISTSVPAEDFGQILYKKADGTYTADLNDESISYKTDYLLKSYNSYTSRYVNDENDIDITINYTLDNFITIDGMIDNIYYTKSGYLINPDRITDIQIPGVIYNEGNIEEIIKSGQYKVSFKVDGQTITYDPGEDKKSLSELEAELERLQTKIIELENKLNLGLTSIEEDRILLTEYIPTYREKTYKLQNMNAAIYYLKSKYFSEWVYENLGEIKQGDTIQETLSEYSYVSTQSEESGIEDYSSFITVFDSSDNTKIFDITEDPEKEDSKFNIHKYSIIKNSIQYNLNLAMSTYNSTAATEEAFYMPVITDEEWDKMLSNISITSFMQGLKCGIKTYNNYAIVSSTNNELTCQIDELYYVEKDYFNNESSVYHKIDCHSFAFDDNKNYVSFTSKEVKYDRVYDKNVGANFYKYDHKNLACYICGIDGNYTATEENKNSSAYYISIGAQRQGLYKMNSVAENQGFETLKNTTQQSSRPLKEIKKIEVVFSNVKCTDFTQNTVSFSILNIFKNEIYVLNTNQSKEQTITLVYDGSISDSKISWETIKNGIIIHGESAVTKETVGQAIKAIKIIYN